MNQELSYATASTDIRQSIIVNADPSTARALCQLDNRHRSICRDRLPIAQKSRICLDSTLSAKECDKIPMFSRQQFLNLIPQNIAIYPEDAIQLTHEFYSQQYKLPTEGFAAALRKAKLMNMICALSRPDFLLDPASAELKLPAYLDFAMIDDIIKKYADTLKAPINDRDGPIDGNVKWFSIGFTLSSGPNKDADYAILRFEHRNLQGDANRLRLRDIFIQIRYRRASTFSEVEGILRDDKFLKAINIETRDKGPAGGYITIESYSSLPEKLINAFLLSRILKVLFDHGLHEKVAIKVNRYPGYLNEHYIL